MKELLFALFTWIFVLAAQDVITSLDCIGGENLACEKVHKRYVPDPTRHPIQEP